MFDAIAPCKGCEQRCIGCHASCEKYSRWKKQHVKIAEKMKKEHLLSQPIRRRRYYTNVGK